MKTESEIMSAPAKEEAKVREALKELICGWDIFINGLEEDLDGHYPAHYQARRSDYEKRIHKAKSALATPLRNCERLPSLWDAVVSFGKEDQGWFDWPDEDVKPGDANELINRLTADQVHELVDWLFVEAK